jgi:chromosome segregation ATPase
MASWDSIWWLVLGGLLGWVGLWICDKLILRDGQIAGLRAEREVATMRAELEGTRERLNRAETDSDTYKRDLAAHTDQADILRTELAVMRNERGSIDTDLGSVKEKTRILQQEIESSRKLAGDRLNEVEQLEKTIIELQGERDKAQSWAQGKDAEAAKLSEQCDQLKQEIAQANEVLGKSAKQIESAQRTHRSMRSQLMTRGKISPRLEQRQTGLMRRLSVTRSTISALAAADEARAATAEKALQSDGEKS